MTLFLSVKHKICKPKNWLLVSCILMLIFITGNAAFSAQAVASAIPGGNIQNSIVRAVDIDKPAIVRILTTLNATLTVHFPNQGSATFPVNGGKYKLQLSGSGAFISPHGDILTADHVVQPPHDTSMDNVLQGLAAEDVANYINQNFARATPYTSAEAYSDLNYGIFASQSQYDTPTSEVYLSTDYTGLIHARTLASMPKSLHAPVEKIEGKSDVAKNDIAIVHVRMNDTPSIILGDSSAVAQQDNLTIIGFPGNGDLGDVDKPDPTTFLTSSVNQIYVSSIKQNSDSGTLIQVGGNVEHGDSGGPALDSKGNIVGIVSFYDHNADTPVGTSFLQASSSVQSVLTSLSSIDLKPGKFQQAWQQAFTHYTSTAAGHWHQASTDFKAMQHTYPDFHGAALFTDYTTAQAKQEPLPQSFSPLFISVALLIILIILLVLAGMWLTRRRKKQLATSTPQSYTSQASRTSRTFVDDSQSIPTIAGEQPKHFNPYAPQPMSWQAFQDLASPDAPVTYNSYNPNIEPATYTPVFEEEIERIQAGQTIENEKKDSTKDPRS